MKKTCLVLGCCAAFQVSASVDWQSMRAELVKEQQLSTMRGKYYASRSGEDLYFGITMITHWSDNASSGSAGMNIEINNRSVEVTRHDGQTTFGTVGASGTHTQGSGMVQLVQIEGSGNHASNQSALDFSSESPVQSSESLTNNVDYYKTSERVGYKVTIGDDSFAIQEVRSLSNAKGAYQGVNLVGNDLIVNNQMLMAVKLPSSWKENKNITLSHSLLKTLK